MQTLDVAAFADLFGVKENSLGERVRQCIKAHDFSYELVEGDERDNLILKVLKTLESNIPVSGPHRLQRWEDGWAENLEAFEKSGYDLNALLPNYYKSGNNVILRLDGRYARPANVNFEVNFLSVLREWIAETYFENIENVCEVGCGPAHNLVAFAKIYPDKNFVGTDWATSSQAIIKLIAEHKGIKIEGARMDLFNPDANFKIRPNSAVITFGCLEQVGKKFQPFLDYLLKQKPKICIHVEPIIELYDDKKLFDWLGAAYSRKRGYLEGYLDALRALEKDDTVEILHVKKNLGSFYHDGWSTVVWKIVK